MKKIKSLNELAVESHHIAKSKGWYDVDPPTVLESLALITSEIGEAVNVYRKVGMEGVKDPSNYGPNYEDKVKTFGSEIADIFIRLADFCGYQGINLEKEVMDKMEHNKTRPMRHGNQHK